MSKALDAGLNRNRTRLYDRQWRLIWDSATATTPAYPYINTWVNACIDQPEGTRWAGRFYRCMEGIRREAYLDLEPRYHLLDWPTTAAAFAFGAER